MIKPISPEEVGKKKKEIYPDFVVEAFNRLIASSYASGSAKVRQKEVTQLMIELAAKENCELTEQQILDYHYLDVEEMYRDEGWKVEYHKPDYTESYPSYYSFSKK